MSLSRWKTRPSVDEKIRLVNSKLEGLALGVWIAIFIYSFLLGQFWIAIVAVIMMIW